MNIVPAFKLLCVDQLRWYQRELREKPNDHDYPKIIKPDFIDLNCAYFASLSNFKLVNSFQLLI